MPPRWRYSGPFGEIRTIFIRGYCGVRTRRAKRLTPSGLVMPESPAEYKRKKENAMRCNSATTAAFGILIAAIPLRAQGPAAPPAPWRGAGPTPCVGTDGGIYQCPPAPRVIAIRAGRLFDSKAGRMLTRQTVVLQG